MSTVPTPFQQFVTTEMGRPPIESGPPWNDENALIWIRWMNGVNKVVKAMVGIGPPGTLPPGGPASVIITLQAGIAALFINGTLNSTNPGTLVSVTDYPHLLIWDGVQLKFKDGGSNYYVLGDHAPNGTDGWVSCIGQVVTYLQSPFAGAAGLGTKTLPNTLGGVSFLSLGGAGNGSFSAAVAPTISGTCSVSGTCTLTAISLTGSTGTGTTGGSVTGGGITGTGTTGTGTTGTGTTGSGSLNTGFSTGGGSLNTGFSTGSGSLSGESTSSSLSSSYIVEYSSASLSSSAIGGSGSASVTGTGTWATNDYTSNASAGGSVFGVSVSASVGIPNSSIAAGIGTDFACGPGDIAGTGVNFSSFVGTTAGFSYSGGSTINVSPGSFSLSAVTLAGLVYVNNTAVTVSGLNIPSFTLTHSHDLSGVTFSGLTIPTVTFSGLSIPAVTFSGLTIPGLSISGLSIPGLTIPSLSIPGLSISSLSVSVTGGTATGTISGSGSISATAGTNGVPRAINLQAWFRI